MRNRKKVSLGEKIYTILYFLDYGKSFGGAVNALLQQAILMKQMGHKVKIFFSDYYGTEMEKGYERICSDLGLTWEWETYQLSSQPEDIDLVCIDKNYEALRKKVMSYRPDILHSVQINVCIELVSRELRIPHIMNVYQLVPDFFTIDYINVFPHYHFCDSWYFAQKWKYYLRTDSMCIRTVVREQGKNRSFVRRALNYICVGSFGERKNQLAVIKAFHKALDSGIQGKLTLYGYADGPYADRCIQYVKQNNLKGKVVIAGFCPNMKEKYAESDVLICGSKVESYPNVISEAMAKGLVIVSTPVAGVPEIIRNRVNGYLTKDYSVDSIYEKIKDLKRDCENGYIEEIIMKMRESFQKYHTPESVSHQLTTCYHYVVKDYHKNKFLFEEELLQIEEIRDTFKELFYEFAQNQKNFSEPLKISLKLWYVFHVKEKIKEICNKKKEVYIWGTGKYGAIVKEMLNVFFPDIYISGYLDSNREGCFLEYKVYKPDEVISKKNVVVFVAAFNGQDEMIESLKNAEKFFNKDYFIFAPRNW